jgi:hypothetical protein
MSSGVSRVAVGAYVGTGAPLEIKAEKIDFQPRKVEIHRITTAIDKGEWIEGMDDSSFIKTVGASGVRTLETTGGIYPLISGFRVGTDASLNNAGDTYRYVAWE